MTDDDIKNEYLTEEESRAFFREQVECNTCAACKFWRQLEPPTKTTLPGGTTFMEWRGFCCFNPPVFSPVDDGEPDDGTWPIVDHFGWCGRFEDNKSRSSSNKGLST